MGRRTIVPDDELQDWMYEAVQGEKRLRCSLTQA